jgi:glycosyltransferase involved in cell wall biosynthesis
METQPNATRFRHRTGLVTLVLPAKDEEAAIGKTLRALPLSTLQTAGFSTQVVVLDGNSTDATAAIARSWGALVVPDNGNGKGAAVREARRHLEGDYVVMLDADGTYPPDAIPRMVARLAWDEADVVVGRRIPTRKAMSRGHRIGNSLLSGTARMLYARPCPDLCSGMWAFRADALRRLPLRSERFGLEAEFFAVAARLHLRVVFLPVDYLPRTGTAKLSWARDGSRILARLVRTRFARLPMEAGPVLTPRDASAPEFAIGAGARREA